MSLVTAPCPSCGRESGLTAVDGGLCLSCTDDRHRERSGIEHHSKARAAGLTSTVVALGIPTRDRGSRIVRQNGVYGFLVRGYGATVDRDGVLVVLREWHFGVYRGRFYRYWGDLALRLDVEAAGGIQPFLDRYRREASG